MRYTQPSHIDAGSIFGSFKFEVSMDKVRPPLFEATNQRLLDEENARTVCGKLCSGRINDFAWLTLRPVLFIPQTISVNTNMPTIEFEEEENRSAFLRALNAISGETLKKIRIQCSLT
jgi:hypothetical protein